MVERLTQSRISLVFHCMGLFLQGKLIKNKWPILNKFLSPAGYCLSSLWTARRAGRGVGVYKKRAGRSPRAGCGRDVRSRLCELCDSSRKEWGSCGPQELLRSQHDLSLPSVYFLSDATADAHLAITEQLALSAGCDNVFCNTTLYHTFRPQGGESNTDWKK
jgi:hypothetical protein